jgi:hypothetical protein
MTPSDHANPPEDDVTSTTIALMSLASSSLNNPALLCSDRFGIVSITLDGLAAYTPKSYLNYQPAMRRGSFQPGRTK